MASPSASTRAMTEVGSAEGGSVVVVVSVVVGVLDAVVGSVVGASVVDGASVVGGSVTGVISTDWSSSRVLVESEAGVPGLEEGGARGPTSFDLLPDGRVVYEMCCEPASGDVYVVDPSAGDPTYVGYGRNPTVSPDGERVAVSVRYEDDEIHVFDVTTPGEDGGPLLAGGQAVIGATGDRSVSGMAWSPDGSTLAIETSRQTQEGESDPAVDVVDLTNGVRQTVPGALHATFLADGRLLVSTEAEPDGAAWPQLVGTALAIVDPATGTSDPVLDAVRVVHLDATADGRWVFAVSEDGAVWALSSADGTDQGTVVTLGGLVAAGG